MQKIQWIHTEEYLRNKNGNMPDPRINPVTRLKDVINEFGQPDFLDPHPKGMAVWTEETLKQRGKIWQSILLIDEAWIHNSPEPHYDFLYTCYRHEVPKNKLCDVIGVSDSIIYDKLKHELTARCHFMGADIATLALAVKVSNGEMSLNEAKKNYGPYIMSTMPGMAGHDNNSAQKFIDFLSQNKEGNMNMHGGADMQKIQWIHTEEYLRNINGNMPDPSINPVTRLKDVINEFGQPDFLDPRPKGMAVWTEETLKQRGKIWQSILLIDEAWIHNSPAPHYDFLYTCYRHEVPKDKVCDVIGVSDSIKYDKLKHELTARCHFMGADIATLALAVKVSNGEMSLNEAIKNYGPYIMSTMPGMLGYDKNSAQKFIDFLSQNKEYNMNMQSGTYNYYKAYQEFKEKYLQFDNK